MQIERKQAAVVRTEDSTAIPAAIADRHFRIVDIFVLVKDLVHGAFELQLMY